MSSLLLRIGIPVVCVLSFACSDDADPNGAGGTSGGTSVSGGAPGATGGTATGGAAAGGAATGGAAMGGAATGGAGGSGTAATGCEAINAPAGAQLPAPKLVIAEISFEGEGHIVIHNNSAAPVDLSRYSFCSNFVWYPAVTTLTTSAMIAPGEFLTLSIEKAFTEFAQAGPDGGELLLFDGAGVPISASVVEDYVCWGNFTGGRKDAESSERYAGPCAGAMTTKALRRIPGTSGEDAASYDTTVAPSTCAK